ncbi:MAG: hypothetical protein IPJ03_15380 [Ignavibacteriales bacterium]|nr:hypothetical protein [Ignavibacteriales bacterium]
MILKASSGIGFLGGALPAVKGLADIQFSDENTNTMEFSTESSDASLELDPVLLNLHLNLTVILNLNFHLIRICSLLFSVELQSLKFSKYFYLRTFRVFNC